VNAPATITAPLAPDTHAAQAERIASHCEQSPGRFFSGAELVAACDVGCCTKVISAMTAAGGLGYGVAKDWRTVTCASGTRTRRVRVYRVTHRPRNAQLPLFTPA
jgi:hypothetical protein